jgi:O-acetyl-ADP-ribose deacetylase (regulator of RNase III)
MVIVRIVSGDITRCDEPCIAFTCNCATTVPRGLVRTIEQRFPYARGHWRRSERNDYYCRRHACIPTPVDNIYNVARFASTPGTVEIFDDGNPKIIYMYAQFLPGQPGEFTNRFNTVLRYNDTREQRIEWFKECVSKLEKLGITDVAMPYHIGSGTKLNSCWQEYQQILNDSPLRIVLYKMVAK